MKKVIYNKYGSIEDLQIIESEIPTIKPNEILIKVKAVAINPLDWKKLEGQLKIITGSKFPKGIAFDFSGSIEKKGDTISTFKVGDDIFGALNAMKGEALAEYIVVTEQMIYKKPSSISFKTAAAMISVGAAALYSFNNANVKSGDNLLINGASGGVGLIAVQMAKSMGMRVTAVASGEGLNYLKKWAPDNIVDYKKESVLTRTNSFDAIFEFAGNLPFNKAKSILKSKSSYVSTLPNPINMITSFFNNIFSSKKHKVVMANPTQDNYRDLCDWVLNKGMEITISKTYPMESFKEAYNYARKGGIVGKVVFTLNQ